MLDLINIEDIKEIALIAGEKIMEIYAMDFSVDFKDDGFPLTKADEIANEIICDMLLDRYPGIPIVSEENSEVAYVKRAFWNYYWCVDPIDGTKEFIKKNGEFTINIALIHINTPVIGIVYAPAIDKMYYAKKGYGAFLNGNKLPILKQNNIFKVVASKSHLSTETENFINEIKKENPHLELDSKGSSLKLCMVAEGSANIYPRLAPTMEWDTAAAQCIVCESGKNVYIYDDKIDAVSYLSNNKSVEVMLYNKKSFTNPYFVVV